MEHAAARHAELNVELGLIYGWISAAEALIIATRALIAEFLKCMFVIYSHIGDTIAKNRCVVV